ncbi:MAG: nucleotidyl transferase AbiEii/AbiGii toxin family protein [Prevotellaceae bacterium]|jgi:predicted nucleotidyltransferase component of viral defense system|nr:nucleotidyl transferase AbiEii/AbiGii toxin family protein [Prevotellaceae bacterium]
MYKKILSQNQINLLPLITSFKREYYLAGGTAIALYIGHRRSIDFDLFRYHAINHKKILDKITKFQFSFKVTIRTAEQINLIVNNVNLTFLEYPFAIPINMIFEGCVRLPSLLDLAAMKSYALGRRAKWKDYVDLYFLLKHFFSINEIAQRSQEIYGELFSVKLFRAQLAYHNDIDYSEEVEYTIPHPPTSDEIRNELIKKATEIF